MAAVTGARRHARGTLDVKSAPGSGTAVLLRVPAQPNDTAARRRALVVTGHSHNRYQGIAATIVL